MSPLFNSAVLNSLSLKYSAKTKVNPLTTMLILFSLILLVQSRGQAIDYHTNVFMTTNTNVERFLQSTKKTDILSSHVSEFSKQNIDQLLSYLRHLSDNSETRLSEIIQSLSKGHEHQNDKVNTYLLNEVETKLWQYESKAADDLYKKLRNSNSVFRLSEFGNNPSKSSKVSADSKWLVMFICQENKIVGVIIISVDAINKSLTHDATLKNSSGEKAKNFQAMSAHSLTSNLIVSEGSMGSILLLAVVIGLLVFGGIAVVKYIKKKKQRANAEQAKIEKLKFIPRIAPTSSDTVFNESINGLKSIFPMKKSGKRDKDRTPKVSTPTYKLPQTLKLEEDNHQSSVINDNIFTNIENSPRSSNGNSPREGAKETPRDINFNIEFSILENDKK